MPRQSAAKFNPKDGNLPATQTMLRLTRSELRSEIRSLRSETQAGFARMESRFSDNESRFSQIDSKLEKVLAEASRIGVLVEEQNSRNRVVLEAITGLWQRQDRVETRMDETEALVREIAKYRS